MREATKLMGMVVKVSPVGEYDKRLVILTRGRGKITAFARGARRPGNQLMAVSRPFAFGEFQLLEGRDSYTLLSAQISNYFPELSQDVALSCYGSYFLEFADYYARENIDGSDLLLLLYQTLRALLNPKLPNELVLLIFELRVMVVNGEYTQYPTKAVSESTTYAWEYICVTALESLYTFVLTKEVQQELKQCVEMNKRKFIDREFHSLEILRMMEGT